MKCRNLNWVPTENNILTSGGSSTWVVKDRCCGYGRLHSPSLRTGADVHLGDTDRIRIRPSPFMLPSQSSHEPPARAPPETKGMLMHHGACLPPVMESPGGRPSRSGYDTDVLTSSSGAKLFRLIDIKPEKQDGSSLAKITLPRGQIISFCQALDAESTKESPEGTLAICFKELDRTRLNVIGFYGSKVLLLECFSCCNTIAADIDDPVYGTMHDDVLLPGLYALLSMDKRTLFVFYWHQGQVFPTASKNGTCVNFVRYLVDLCDTVFILLEGSDESISERLISRPRGLNRKREIRIQRLQTTTNTAELFRGFSLPLQIPASAIDQPTKVEYEKELEICEGSRCGILSRMLAPPRRFWCPREVFVRLQEMSTGLALFIGKPVDFTFEGLELENLSIFLQCSDSPPGKQYLGLLQKQRQRRDDFAKTNGSDREQRLIKYEEMVQEAITNFILEYLKAAQVFSWEEVLLKDASLEVLLGMLPSSHDQKSLESGALQKHPGSSYSTRTPWYP
ncbi:hypothetical protein R1sor_004218 [Riccia sorocarpa]|uniref:Uncharacterized protein n=1 Tax=Riccia sorocarpa TaxID=122646 RepID=A0ABD3H5R3_9MARC